MSERHIPIEISVATEPDERPGVEAGTRLDVSVNGNLYPTARLEDGKYVAWWFDTEAPAPDDPATSEWVTAPTRFLAAGTLHELWEDPAAFDELTEGDAETVGDAQSVSEEGTVDDAESVNEEGTVDDAESVNEEETVDDAESVNEEGTDTSTGSGDANPRVRTRPAESPR